MKIFIVACTCWINLPPKHWWSSGHTQYAISQYKLQAPDQDTAESLGVFRMLEYRRKNNPGCEIVLQGIISTDITPPSPTTEL